MFLYALEESVDCHLLSSFCDDSNLHISIQVCTFHKFADRFLAYTHRGKYIYITSNLLALQIYTSENMQGNHVQMSSAIQPSVWLRSIDEHQNALNILTMYN